MKKFFLYFFFIFLTKIAFAQEELSILFTHDLHSSFLGADRHGGYARLFTLIEKERSQNPANTILLDAGDIAMGSFFHSLFTTENNELRLMGQMGYEFITLGNHDFDFGTDALSDALQAAKQRPPTPSIVIANIKSKKADNLKKAMDNYGVKEYTIIEKAGKRIGIFGLLGNEAFDNIPNVSTLDFEKPLDCAKRIVKILREQEKTELIICLSHSNINSTKKYSEDEMLAKKVNGIDVIISGHSHTVLSQPVLVNNTIIGAAGAYGNFLGVIKLNIDSPKPRLASYKLIPVDSLISENTSIRDSIASFKEKVNERYLHPFGLHFDDTVAHSDFTLAAQADSNGASALGKLIADAYKHAALVNGKTAHIGVAISGSIRENLYAGYITADEVFNVLSLGLGADNKVGYPLVLLHLNGKELWDLCELDASISPSLTYAQLFFSGLRYEYNPYRLFCNRVTKVEVMDEYGNFAAPEAEKLYGIAVGFYSAQMLGVVKSKTFGILSINPKTADGIPATDYVPAIIKDTAGNEVKEWLAFVNYLRGLKNIPVHYTFTEKQKIRLADSSITAKINSPNRFAWIVYSVGFMLLSSIVILTIFVVRKIRHGNK